MIPYGRQEITQADIDAVTAVLNSDFITQGPAVPAFEQAVIAACGAPGAVAVSSATAALHIVYLALGVGPGDIVWTSPNTFAATANAARYCGASVDFVDIDYETCNLDINLLRQRLEQADAAGKLPKLVVPVHFGGLSCDMRGIAELSARYGFRVVEDASHAVGGIYNRSNIGDCRHSDAVVFSFHPVKIVTTGEGGMIMAKDTEILDRCALLRSHGITRDTNLMDREPDGPWYYQMLELGFNYRMTDIQAALGLSQIGRLSRYVERRNEIADVYNSAFSDTPLGIPCQMQDATSAYHLYPIHWPQGGASRRNAFDALRRAGIGVNVHYIPVHRLPYYESQGFRAGDFPIAEAHYDRAISLPMFPSMTADEQQFVIKTVLGLLD